MQLGFADSTYTGPCFQGLSSLDISSFVQSVNSSFLDCERGCKSIISDSDLDSNTCNYPEWGRASNADVESNSSSKTVDMQPLLTDKAIYSKNTELLRSVKYSANLAMWRSQGRPEMGSYVELSAVDRENIRQAIGCDAPNDCINTSKWLEMRSDIDADIISPNEGNVLELARTNPWQLGIPKDGATVENDLYNGDNGLREAPMIVATGRVAEMALDNEKVTCQRREEGPQSQMEPVSSGGPARRNSTKAFVTTNCWKGALM